MSDIFLAPSLVVLRNEINARFPHRDHSSDGWLGDASHAARVSDHNPCWACPGRLHAIVRATDTDADDNDPQHDLMRELLSIAVRDDRTWYFIHKFPGQPSRIWSRTYGFQPRLYFGSNQHDHHAHISINHDERSAFDTSSWFDLIKPPFRPRVIDLSALQQQMLAGIHGVDRTPGPNVKALQTLLNMKLDAQLTVDGIVGDATIRAWGRFEHGHVIGRPRIVDHRNLARLVRGTKFGIRE